MPSFLKSLGKAIKGSSDGGASKQEDSPLSPTSPTAREQVLKSITDGLPLHEAHAHSNAKIHPDAHPDGGLACNNDALLKEQRDAITRWIGTMGKKLFTGNFNLMNTPMPVDMFESRSYLEKLADVWVYSRYLLRASSATDPVERLKLTVTWFIAGLHHGFEKWKKPFNPILGETWQARMSDGSTIFMEQISHHPPVSAFNLHGPDGAYKFIGLSQPTVSLVPKYYGFKTTAKGFRYLEFADGTRIDIQFPGYYVKGVVYSTRPRAEVDGSAVFTDERNGLRAVVRFGPNKGARAPVLRRSDAVIGEIYRVHGYGSDPQQSDEPMRPATPPVPDVDSDSSRQDLSLSQQEDIASMRAGQLRSCDSDSGFETASESEFEMRELREHAERDRGSESPLLGAHHQRTQSQGRILADAAAAAVAAVSREEGLLDDEELHAVSPTLHRLVPPPSQSAPMMSTTPHHGSSESLYSSVTKSNSGLPGGIGAASAASAPVLTTSAPARNGASSNSGWPPVAAPTAPSRSSKQSESGGGGWGFSKLIGIGTQSGNSGSAADTEVQGEIVARIEGSWLSHINIDNCRYWTLDSETPDRWIPENEGVALPSDVRYRLDLQCVLAGDLQAAQKAKEKLEKQQRRDKELREAGGARLH